MASVRLCDKTDSTLRDQKGNEKSVLLLCCFVLFLLSSFDQV